MIEKTLYRNKSCSLSIVKTDWNGIQCYITCGVNCGNACYCKFSHKCRFAKKNYNWHNFWVEVHRFFEYRLHINLPHSHISFNKKTEWLSGTEKCPYHTTRETGCHDCMFCDGMDEYYHLACGLLRDGRQLETYDDKFWTFQCSEYKPYKSKE